MVVKTKLQKNGKQISHQNKRKEVNLGSVVIRIIRRDSTMLFGVKPYDIKCHCLPHDINAIVCQLQSLTLLFNECSTCITGNPASQKTYQIILRAFKINAVVVCKALQIISYDF